MTKPDLALSQIAARFTQHDVEWSRGAFMIIDRRTTNPIARLRPIPDTDRFELFYWSNAKGRWTTFGNLGRMKLILRTRSSRAIPCSACRAADKPVQNWPKSSLVGVLREAPAELDPGEDDDPFGN